MTRAKSDLERAALWLWRERNNTDAEFWKIDQTCTCSWCRARRALVKACEERTK